MSDGSRLVGVGFSLLIPMDEVLAFLHAFRKTGRVAGDGGPRVDITQFHPVFPPDFNRIHMEDMGDLIDMKTLLEIAYVIQVFV